MMFSFVVPVFGSEAYLPRCLDSLMAQTDPDFEIIVVDDCSPGNCREIVDRYGGRCRYLRHERNLSLLQARITGLKAAEGEWVIPLDSDDFVAPGLVAALKQEVSSHPTTQIVAYQRMTVDGVRKPYPELRYRSAFLSGAEALGLLFRSKLQCAIGGKAVRRALYLEMVEKLDVGSDFYLNSSEDLCQTFPLLALAANVSVVDYPGYFYQINPDSLTNTLAEPTRMGRATENTARVFSVLERFVRHHIVADGLAARLETHKLRTVEWYLGCVRHSELALWLACVGEICRHFDPALVARAAMEHILHSRTYRLGERLTRLPCWFLGLLRRNVV